MSRSRTLGPDAADRVPSGRRHCRQQTGHCVLRVGQCHRTVEFRRVDGESSARTPRRRRTSRSRSRRTRGFGIDDCKPPPARSGGHHPFASQADEVDTKRPRPTDKRVWASLEKSARGVVREAFAEALRRDPQKARSWVVLVDGEPKQLRVVKAEAQRAGVKLTILAPRRHRALQVSASIARGSPTLRRRSHRGRVSAGAGRAR